jgi:hypothetical protein
MSAAQLSNQVGNQDKKPEADQDVPQIDERTCVSLSGCQFGDQPGNTAQNGHRPSLPSIHKPGCSSNGGYIKQGKANFIPRQVIHDPQQANRCDACRDPERMAAMLERFKNSIHSQRSSPSSPGWSHLAFVRVKYPLAMLR